jgi:UDP-N-acetylglucosamine enolpyruvyl transferase
VSRTITNTTDVINPSGAGYTYPAHPPFTVACWWWPNFDQNDSMDHTLWEMRGLNWNLWCRVVKLASNQFLAGPWCFGEAGITIEEGPDWVRVCATERPRPLAVKTLPYPGFPTDMQQPVTSLLAITAGTSVVTETIYERRFRHVDELRQMGADIRLEGQSAIITGVPSLTAARVNASDLRAGAALIVAGLMARGTTEISGVEHIERGYEDVAGKCSRLGATIGCVEEQ